MLLDLGKVTQTLLNVIKAAVPKSSAWPLGQMLDASPNPPDRLAGNNALGLYLYHLGEDPATKAWVPMPGAPPDLRFTPMGLQLFYLLRAHSEIDNPPGEGTLREQLIMGLAVKALRDYPIIDDTTEVFGTPVLDGKLTNKDNRLRLTLQPIAPSEAVSYWTADKALLRLTAYFAVTIALIEPDDVQLRTGRVSRYGVDVFTDGTPYLDSSLAKISFTPPDLPLQTVETKPAQVPIGGELELLGSGLVGDRVELAIQRGDWPEFVKVGPSWGVVATDDKLFARADDVAGTSPITPGIYAAVVIVTRTFTLPDGSTRDYAKRSNATPFTITPNVTSIVPALPAATFTVNGRGFTPAAGVEVYLGATALVANPGAPGPGEFQRVDDHTLVVSWPTGTPPGTTALLRICVAATESPPRWVVAPP